MTKLRGEEPSFAPFYDPCCGSGTIAIEAAQIACNIAPGSTRRFGFEKLLPYQPHVWDAIKSEAAQAVLTPAERENIQIFGSDVSFRMVDFATRNAERAGVADVVQFRGGDALQRMPPCENEKKNGIMIVNPPYGDRIGISGVAGQNARRSGGRENAQQHGQQNPRQSSNQNANTTLMLAILSKTDNPTNPVSANAKPHKPKTATSFSRNCQRTGRKTTPAGPPTY